MAIKSWQEKWQAGVQDSVFACLSLPQTRDILMRIASVRPQLTNRHEVARKLESMNIGIVTRVTAIQNLIKELELTSPSSSQQRSKPLPP